MEPESPLGDPSFSDVDHGSRLMSAAEPVLDELTRQLSENRLCVLLTDRDCRMAYRWIGERELRIALDGIGGLPGSSFDEARMGTNALGTAHEVRHAVEIHGSEHYLAALKSFSCYGHPIRHPLTGRFEGVLSVTVMAETCNPLVSPVVARAVADIEGRMVEGARAEEQRLFRTFQQATHLRSNPVAVLGGDIVLANRACLDLLGHAGPMVLRTLLEDAPADGNARRILHIADGQRVEVSAERIEGTRGGALFRLGRLHRDSPPRRLSPTGARCRSLFITGEPGTGRSSTVAEFAGGAELTVFDSATALLAEEQEWARRFQELAARPGVMLAVEDVHLFPERLVRVMLDALHRDVPARLAFTGCPAGELPSAVAGLAAHCDRRVDLPPLRDRLPELPALAESMLRERLAGKDLTFSARAIAALCAQPWLGNLTELRALVEQIAQRPNTGIVDLAQLPKEYVPSARIRRLGGRELAERGAIIKALQATAGNKLRAAGELGISRTTLYRRIRALDIAEDCSIV